VREPQSPQPCEAPGEQAPSPEQPPHWQFDWQVREPQLPQPCVLPDEQTPSPEQPPHRQSLWHVWVPQFPQPCEAPGEQTPPPEQPLHWQLSWQYWLPQYPQPWEVPGEQTPSLSQLPHVLASLQVRVPQYPQDSMEPGTHSPSSTQSHGPQLQSERHVLSWCPAVPHEPPSSTSPTQQLKLLSHWSLQSSSSPLHDSSGGVQAEAGGAAHVSVQIPVPCVEQDVVHSTSAPIAQSKPLSTTPSQSSSTPLQISSVPEEVHVSQFPSPSSSDQPARHSTEHVPSVQTAVEWRPASQAFPQAPQCSTSVSVSTHAPSQAVLSAGHSMMQEPLMQVSKGWQALSQRPQWSWFDMTMTHSAPQAAWPEGQSPWTMSSQSGT
jgi:hypothetical protein